MEFLGVRVHMVPSVLGAVSSVWVYGDVEIDDSVLDGHGILRLAFRFWYRVSHDLFPEFSGIIRHFEEVSNLIMIRSSGRMRRRGAMFWYNWFISFDMHLYFDFNFWIFEEGRHHPPRKGCDVEGLDVMVVLVVGVVVVVVEHFFDLLRGRDVPCKSVSDSVIHVVFGSERLLRQHPCLEALPADSF